ncbi:major capsid protein [Ramlibacter humi]|uniref:Methyltransferase n=1 Tax=Ramlibacter humi TaxID=2530451 RepID=A0A4Z0BKP6_9BURK|nr:major capsid protein [Ramlibacter humi]TFY99003.1 hypothetical protein EZ216_15685 [Ramlibacter humi]
MLKTFRDRAMAMFAALFVFAFASPAAMAAIDTTATVGELNDVKTAVSAVGIAVLSIAVGIMLYKWVKRAL